MESLVCAAILFDLDGVLVESIGSVERQWTIWAGEHGLDAQTVLPVAHGRPTIETIREFAPHISPAIDIKAEALKMEEREIADMDCVHQVPGAKELLSGIPAGRWTIVTSGTRALAEARLRYVGLTIPANMVTASEITRGKPDPEPYLKGASALKIPPQDCLVIEDAPSGIRAGHAAGMKVIAIPTTYGRDKVAEADFVVERLADLRLESRNGRIEIELPPITRAR